MDFIDLKTQYQHYKAEIHDAIEKVMIAAAFIKGPALHAFEQELKEHSGAAHVIGCSSGTDALLLGMMAKELQPHGEVLVPDFTFFATAEMVRLIGGVPVFVDIDPTTYNMDPLRIRERITDRTVGIMPVSLYGQCADLDAINSIAESRGLWVLEDAAQSYGATYKDRKSCAITTLAATSFFPAKPLGCYGDGGAVFTDNDDLAEQVRVILNHGQSKRYYHSHIGINGRLDTLQAAILSVKLRHFEDEVTAKRRVATWYDEQLKDDVVVPHIAEGNESVWAQYTIRVPKRETVQAHLKEKGIPTAIHYPLPLHRQPALADLGATDDDYPAATKASTEVMSLPMHPFMTEEQVQFVATAIVEAIRG